MAKKQTALPASDFTPDLDSFKGLAVTDEYAYYLGVTGDCPVTQIDCVGLNFPMRQEVFRPDPMHPGQRRREPVIGGMNKRINIDHIHALRECLKRMVIRFKDEPAQKEEQGTGKNIGADHQRLRRGKLVKIPTSEQLLLAQKERLHVNRYVRQPNDEPAVRYMYFKLCPDQANPARGHDFSTIEESGIIWPGELDAELETLLN